MASMPRKANAPATPAPATTVGYEAPPVASIGEPERVAEETVLTTVELPPTGAPLAAVPVQAQVEETEDASVDVGVSVVTAAAVVEDEVAGGVVVAAAETG